MKILFINSVCGIRSTGRIVAETAEKYLSQGCEVRIAYGRETSPQKYQSISYKICDEVGVRINALRARLFDNEGFNAIRQTKKFLKWANDYNPDVLWLHNLHGYYINIELLFEWIKSRPNMEVRWTLHDCWTITGHCSHFDYARCERWKTTCQKCKQKLEYPTSWFYDNSKRNFTRKKELFTNIEKMTIYTPSYWLASLVNESFLSGYCCEVVHNQIDLDIFKPTSGDFRKNNNLENKKIVLGVSSVWNRKKGYYDFLNLANMLDDSYVVVMVGLSTKQVKQVKKKGIVGLERTNSVSQLAEVYTTSNVFVNLTYEDTYPTVNLEAQACGTPCITYRTGGSVESVPENNIIKQGDLEGIVKKIQEICAEV